MPEKVPYNQRHVDLFRNDLQKVSLKEEPFSYQRASEVPFGRYDKIFYGIDNEELYARRQSAVDQLANGAAKMAGTFATSFLEGTVGIINGIGAMASTGKFSSFYDNDFNRRLDELNKSLEDALPNYYTQAEKDAEWYSPKNIMSANFLGDKVLKNLGYSFGALAGGIGWGALLKGVGLTNRLVRAGQGLRTVEAVETAMANTPKLQQFGTINNTLNSLWQGSKNIAGVALNNSERAIISSMGMVGEATVEAYQAANQFRDKLIQDYKNLYGFAPKGDDLQEINEYADSVGNTTFGANAALLTLTNYIQLPKILGSSRTLEKRMINSIEKETGLPTDKFVSGVPSRGNILSPLFSKLGGVGKSVDKYLLGPGRLAFSVGEAFEEGAQYAIQTGSEDYFNRAYKDREETKSFIDGVGGVLGNIFTEGARRALSDKEGLESMLIGGFSGALQKIRGNVVERGFMGEGGVYGRNTQLALNALNKTNLKEVLEDGVKYTGIAIQSQKLRQEAIEDNDVLSEKDYEKDYALSYIIPRVKYGKVDSIFQEVGYYREQAMTDTGFQELQDAGIALPGETREKFLERLSGIENTAKDVNQMYSMIEDKYSAITDDEGKPLYTPDVIDRLAYISAKVKDYDQRLFDLSTKLQGDGVNTLDVLKAVADSEGFMKGSVKETLSNKAVKDAIDKESLSIVEQDSLEPEGKLQDLLDLTRLSVIRQSYLNDYATVKSSPEQFRQAEKKEVEEVVPEEKETIKVKTKAGEREIELGTEYFVGKGVDYDKQGLEVPVEVSSLVILGENADGTIKIKDDKGQVRNISKDVLENYNLANADKLRSDKTANYFRKHRNEVFEYNFGKDFGGRKTGRLEYKNGSLFFVYKDDKGKIRRKKLKKENFVAQEGFEKPRISSVGRIETEEQRIAREEFTSAEEIAKERETLARNRDLRLEIVTQLETETRERLDDVNKKLENKKSQLESIQKDLDKIGDEVRVAEPRTKREKALEAKYPELSRQKIRFGKVFSTTSKALSQLSRMREDVQNEIGKLTAEKEELEFNLSYFEDFGQNLDELPENSGEFLKELKEQVKWIGMLVDETGQNINTLSKLSKTIEEAIKDFVALLKDSMQKFDQDYPDYIKDTLADIEGGNFIIKNFADLKEYLADYAVIKDLQSEISVSEAKLRDTEENIDKLYNQLNELGNEYEAKKQILDRFQSVADAYAARKAEEEKMMTDKQLIEQAVGTADTGVQTVPFDKEYEPDSKKSDEIIGRATMGIMRGKPHQIRTNNFGFNLNKFENRDSIRGVYVTSKNEDQILPGLTDLLRTDEAGQINEDIEKDEIIALVMVQENPDGTIVLVGEDGQPIADGVNQLDAAVFQVYPDGDLKWGAEYDNKSMFRDPNNPDRKDLITSVTSQYKAWRKSVLDNPSLEERHKIEASFGRLEDVRDDQGNIVYETRTSVQDANLATADDLEAKQLIVIPTLASEGENIAVISQGTVTFRVPVGTVILDMPNGLVKLQNRKHSRKEAETIFQAILQQAKYMIDPKVGLEDPKAVRLFDWLRSVTYWGIPRDQQGNRKEAGYNSIFWEVDEESGKFMLSLSGKGKDFVFTPRNLEENRETIITMISAMYNNVNNAMTKQLNESYEEILSIADNGDITSRIWKNYQSYLLSNTTPEGKARSGEELPLSTLMRPTVGPEDVNRTNIYFYTTDTADDFAIPVVEKKKPVVPKKLVPGAPKPAAKPAPKPAEEELVVGEEEEFVIGEEEAAPKYELNGKTTNIYTSPKTGKKIKFIATTAASPTNLDAIKVVKGEDFDEVAKTIKDAGKDPKTEILKTIYKAIAPQIEQELQEEDEEFTIPEEVIEATEKQTGTVPNKAVTDALKKKIKGLSDKAMRLTIEKELKAFQPENWNQVETWLKANFPNIPVYRVKNIIQATNGRQAWGMFKDGAIYIYENAEVGTVYHEVFHAVWRMASSPEEQKAVMDELKARSGTFFDRASLKDVKYSEATEEQLEEKLAEEFRDYVQFKKIPAKPAKGRPFILKLFADLVTMIKEFFLGPQSASKVEDMFGKIGRGYYKSYIPYESSLSFAKKGVIDVEDAFAGSDSVLSLTGITDRQRADIINQMTYLTLLDVIKTDESLFNIDKRNKKEVYSTLKEQILQTIGKKIQALQALVDEKVITQEEAIPLQSQTMQLMQEVDNQWATITERHEEYLKAYSIEFDENDNLNLRGEDNSGRETYQDATKIDNFKKANSAIKLLLATIPLVDNEGNIEPSSIGGAQLLPVGKTYISLMNNLHDSASVEEMLERLRDMAVNDPNYRTLYERITKRPWSDGGVDLSPITTEHGLQLISGIWNTFKKQAPDVKNVFILENGDVVVGEANLSTAAQQLRSQYVNSIVLKAREGQGFFIYDPKRNIFKGDPAKVVGMELNEPRQKISFLNKMGIQFSLSDYNKMSTSQKKGFNDAVLGIRESISKTEEIATFSGKVLDINKRLLTLGLLKAAIDNPEFSSTFFNVSGERTQTYIGTNAVSELSEFLNKLTKFNKDSVGGTKYSYLLTDSFAQGSNLLSRKYTSAGTLKKDAEDLFKVGYVSGLVNEEKGKRIESSRLTYKDRLVQELNLNLAGWYLNLVPGDASIEHMIKMGNPISYQSINRGFGEVNEIFKQYFISELKLAREDRPVAEGRKSNEMRFFKGILGQEIHDAVMRDGGPVEEVYNRFESRINAKLEEFIKKDVEKLRLTLERFGILTTDENGYTLENVGIPNELGTKQIDSHLTMLTANYMIANIEMHKLLYSDPYQYEDELKRVKSFNSPRQAIINNSPKMNTAFSNVWNKSYKPGDIGFTKFTQDYFRSATHKDVIGIINLPNYTKFKETDGSGIISMKANRHFRIRASNWNSDEERQYKYDVAWEKKYKSKGLTDEEIQKKGLKLSKEELAILAAGNPGIQSAYTPLKPIVSGSKLGKNGLPSSYNNVVLDKFALYPLSYRVVKEINDDANAAKLYDKMQKEDIDYIVFTSGRKVGAENPHDTYKDGVFNEDPYKAVINVPFSIMSVQSEVPSKEDNLVTRGSQVTKLITVDFLEAGVPIDFMPEESDFSKRYKAWNSLTDKESYNDGKNLFKEIKNNQNLLEALTDWGYKNTLDRLGIKESTYKDPNGIIRKKFEIVDRSKAVQTLREEILKREVNDNISDALAGFLQGKVVLEATPAYQQVRNILFSIADKAFISPKINGGMKVQIPSTLLESGMRNVKDGLYESDVLKFYEKDGKRIAEVMLGRWFDTDMSDDELLKYLNTTDEGQKILAGVGFRIPTQKQNSIDAIVIKKFLPKEFGDSVVIPAALVQKVGSDFDIDKLSVYLKNTYVKNGKPKLIPYFGIGEQAIQKFADLYDKGEFLSDEERKELERYISEEQLLLQDVAEESAGGKLMTAIFGKLFSEQELTEEFTRGIPAKDQIINKLYKKSLENEYIQSMENLITHPQNYDNLIKPNSVDPLKDLSIEIAKKTVGQSFDYTNVDNMLDRTFMSRLRHAFVTGKYAIGIAAVNNTNHSLNQRQPIYIDKDKISLLSEEDKYWIANGDIKFSNYNKIEIDKKMVPTLSMIKNKAGEYISDIIGQFIDGYVDIAKGPWIMELGATPNVASTWLFLIKLGVPVKTVTYFMNQPIVRDYLRKIDSAGYSWLFIDNFVDDVSSIYGDPIDPTQLKQLMNSFSIPSEYELRKMVGANVDSLSSQQKRQQQLILREFLKYAKMAEQMFIVTQGSNYDTSTFNDPMLVFKKQMQQAKAQNTIISSVETLLANSFIGDTAEKIGDIRDAFAEFLPSDQKNIRKVIQNVLMPFVDMNDRTFVKTAQKAVNDLFDWAVQNDQNLNEMIQDILVDDGGVGKEALEFANRVKNDINHPLYDNYVVNILESIASRRASGGANNMKLNMGETKVYDQNNVIYAFRELREYLNGENNPLYERIKLLAVLQSGLSSSPISFTSLLPYEDFEEIYNKTLVKIDGLRNLQDFYNLGVFQRNNWNNDDITPYLRARTITAESGRKHYNPSMKFLPDTVKEATLANEIPPVMTLSQRNRESNSEYIVYTWEKELELLTEDEINNNKPYAQQKLIREKKAQMRKAGDYSYINKALFRKVTDSYGTPLETRDRKGQPYFVYKAINAWGDSFRANEFWDVDHKSVLENGFLKVEDVDNNVIITKFLDGKKVKTNFDNFKNKLNRKDC